MRGYPSFNFPAFDAAAKDLISRGWRVINPAQMDRDIGFEPDAHPSAITQEFLEGCVKRDCNALLRVDALFLLPGWEMSTGATAEKALAHWRRIPVYLYATGELLAEKKGRLIALIGPKGAGKTFLAEMVAEATGAIKMTFARPLRDMLEAIGVTEYYHTHNKMEPIPHIPGNPTARHLLQTLGTEWGRDMVHSNIWATVASHKFKAAMVEGQTVIVDDLRFLNEAEVARDLRGTIVKVTRPGLDLTDEHRSERYWRDIDSDFSLHNDGSADVLLKSYQKLFHMEQ